MHNKYPLSLRILHWGIALVMISLVAIGFLMAEILPKPQAFAFYGIHKQLGLTLFGLVLVRIGVRLTTDQVPPMGRHRAWYERVLARLTYLGFYILMIGFPISGYVMSSAGGYPIEWLGISVPLLISKNPELSHMAKEAHEFFGYSFLVLLSLHILGFLKHWIIDKDNLLKKMW